MGAQTFSTTATGTTAIEAFKAAVEAARYSYGNDGYTGSIAEKSSFQMIALPAGREASDYAEELIEVDDRRISDKWGPAGCIQTGATEFYFFGWASC